VARSFWRLRGVMLAAAPPNALLVRLPLPPQDDEVRVTHAVAAIKDVDGFGPESLGLLTAGHPR